MGWRSGHALLAALTPEEWDYHQAEYRLHPTGDDHERTSKLISWMVNILQRLAPGSNSDELEWIPEDAFVPGRKPKDETINDLEQAAREMESLRI